LAEWAEQWRYHGGQTGKDIAALLDRAGALVKGVADDVAVVLEPVAAPEPPVDEPRGG
jgi:hypothetical protein